MHKKKNSMREALAKMWGIEEKVIKTHLTKRKKRSIMVRKRERQ